MEVVCIRHFQTAGNLRKCYIGVSDEPIVRQEHFVEMVSLRRESLPPVDVVVASPMLRCIETAKCLYPTQDVMVEESLRECDFGLFEGKNYEELKENPDYQKWLASGGTIPFPQGEAHEDFKMRCVKGFEKMTEQLIEEGVSRVAYIVHGGTIMAMMQALDEDGHDFYHWQVGNGEGYSFQIDEKEWRQGIRRMKEIRKR